MYFKICFLVFQNTHIFQNTPQNKLWTAFNQSKVLKLFFQKKKRREVAIRTKYPTSQNTNLVNTPKIMSFCPWDWVFWIHGSPSCAVVQGEDGLT